MFSFSQEINRNSHYQTNLAYLNWIPLRKCNDLLILKVNDMNWIESIWHILWNKIIKSTRCMWLSARFLACSSRTSFNCSRSSFAEWVIKTRSIIAGCPIVLKMRDLIILIDLSKLFQKYMIVRSSELISFKWLRSSFFWKLSYLIYSIVVSCPIVCNSRSSTTYEKIFCNMCH